MFLSQCGAKILETRKAFFFKVTILSKIVKKQKSVSYEISFGFLFYFFVNERAFG